MAECQLTLNPEERDLLVELLDTALRDIRVEEHRTRAPNYREHILHREELIADLLARLEQTTAQQV